MIGFLSLVSDRNLQLQCSGNSGDLISPPLPLSPSTENKIALPAGRFFEIVNY
jgi:hypothetical protein